MTPPFAIFPVIQRVPVWLRYIGAIISAIALLWAIRAIYDRSVIRNHETQTEIATIRATQAGNEAAAAASASTAANVEARNETARKAADQSADPLKAGLDALRK